MEKVIESYHIVVSYHFQCHGRVTLYKLEANRFGHDGKITVIVVTNGEREAVMQNGALL